MEPLKIKWLGLSWTLKFYWIIGIHFLINIITGILFFLNEFSILSQIAHTIIHLTFFILLIKLIYIPKKENRLRKKNEKYWFLGFIILNLIPFFQDYVPADSGFVPTWAKLPQINFGLPFTYGRWITADSQYIQENMSNPIFHMNVLTFNLYFLGLITIIGLMIKKKLAGKINLPKN